MPQTLANDKAPKLSQHDFPPAKIPSLPLVPSQFQQPIHHEEYPSVLDTKKDMNEDKLLVNAKNDSIAIYSNISINICCVKSCNIICVADKDRCARHQRSLEYRRARAKQCQEENRCIQCFKPEIQIDKGGRPVYYCKHCRERKVVASKRRWEKKKVSGLCQNCSKPSRGYSRCEECRQARNTLRTKPKRAAPAAPTAPTGECEVCLQPSGSFKRCIKCRRKGKRLNRELRERKLQAVGGNHKEHSDKKGTDADKPSIRSGSN